MFLMYRRIIFCIARHFFRYIICNRIRYIKRYIIVTTLHRYIDTSIHNFYIFFHKIFKENIICVVALYRNYVSLYRCSVVAKLCIVVAFQRFSVVVFQRFSVLAFQRCDDHVSNIYRIRYKIMQRSFCSDVARYHAIQKRKEPATFAVLFYVKS